MRLLFSKIFSNDRAIAVFSVIMAIICWFVVALTIDTESTVEIKDVPVDLEAQSNSLSGMDIHAIDADDLKVDVHLRGERLILGGIDKEDVQIVADLSKVTGPGTAEISLSAVNNSKEKFEVISIKPSTVTVKFDRLLNKKLPVTAQIEGLSVGQDFVVETETVSPAEINISGPEIDVGKIEKCVVKVEVNDKLEKSSTYRSEILLLDAQGEPVKSEYVSADAREAEVMIPVKKIETLPLTVEFINVPPAFPMDELSYTLSNSFITVAGNIDVLSRYSEISLGYIDMKNLDFSGNYTFDVELPGGFTNIDHIETVEVLFDETNIGESVFTLKNFTIKNRPANYDVQVTTTRLTNVRIVGDQTILNSMTSDDIIAEIDLSDRNIQPGQFSVPLKIYMPTKGLAWAVGDYSAIINVKQS